MQRFIIRITQENLNLANYPEIGCFILPDTVSENFGKEFVESAHKENRLVLVQGQNATEFYKQSGADGLIVDTAQETNPAKAIKAVKKTVPKAILGAICRNRRHEAMVVSECEPDFVIFKFWKDGFEHNRELLNWYAELFLLQNAAQIEEDCEFESLNADFIILDDMKFMTYKQHKG